MLCTPTQLLSNSGLAPDLRLHLRVPPRGNAASPPPHDAMRLGIIKPVCESHLGRQRSEATAGGRLGSRERKMAALVGSCPLPPNGAWMRECSCGSVGSMGPSPEGGQEELSRERGWTGAQSPGGRQPREERCRLHQRSYSLRSSLQRGLHSPHRSAHERKGLPCPPFLGEQIPSASCTLPSALCPLSPLPGRLLQSQEDWGVVSTGQKNTPLRRPSPATGLGVRCRESDTGWHWAFGCDTGWVSMVKNRTVIPTKRIKDV